MMLGGESVSSLSSTAGGTMTWLVTVVASTLSSSRRVALAWATVALILLLWHFLFATLTVSRINTVSDYDFQPTSLGVVNTTALGVPFPRDDNSNNNTGTLPFQNWTQNLVTCLSMMGTSFSFTNDRLADYSIREYSFDDIVQQQQQDIISVTQLTGDLTHGPYNQCGKAKCFVQSKSNETQGWLITFDYVFKLAYGHRRRGVMNNKKSANPRTRWHSMTYAWKTAFDLQERYGLPHFFLEDSPPMLFQNVTQQEIDLYRQRIQDIWQAQPEASQRESDWKSWERIRRAVIDEGRHLVAQRVFRAPGNIKVVKRRRSISRFRRLITLQVDDDDDVPPPTKAPQFYTNLLTGIRRMRDMLRDEPALWHDFQFAVDRVTGQVYQIDLDRQFEFFYTFPVEPACYQLFRKGESKRVDCLWNQYLAEIVWETISNDKDFNTSGSIRLKYTGPDPNECTVGDVSRPCWK